jgi:hypothetical protein
MFYEGYGVKCGAIKNTLGHTLEAPNFKQITSNQLIFCELFISMFGEILFPFIRCNLFIMLKQCKPSECIFLALRLGP